SRLPVFLRSMDWMARAARLDRPGAGGFLVQGGLAAIFLAVVPVFLADEGADLARTMAALDRQVKRADALMRRLPSGLFQRSSAIDGTWSSAIVKKKP
ncbi:MAG: hypothetical protein WAZ62_18635, partial [Zavarzinia sp.]